MKLPTALAIAPLLAIVASTDVPTPAPSSLGGSSTPSPTTAAIGNCIEVSVEGDATYCIAGPICSGAGDAPAGSNCPKKGDVAIKDCLKYLKSYADGDKCVAPIDAKCVKIKTGAWGCVWGAASPCTGIPGWEKPTPAPSAPSTPCTGIPGWEKPPAATPCTGIPGWEKPSQAPSTPCPVIPGWEKPTPAPSTPCPVIPGWEKPTPAPSTPCPVIPGWEKPTPAPSTPCPVIPGWEPSTAPPSVEPSTAPTSTTTPPVNQPTTVPPTTTVPASSPPTLAVQLASSSEAQADHGKQSTSSLAVLGVVAVGAVAAMAIAVVAVKKRQPKNPFDDEPTVYRGSVQTPV